MRELGILFLLSSVSFMLDWRKGVVCIDAQEGKYDLYERFLLLSEIQMGGRKGVLFVTKCRHYI
jgi:hypothetical protein